MNILWTDGYWPQRIKQARSEQGLKVLRDNVAIVLAMHHDASTVRQEAQQQPESIKE